MAAEGGGAAEEAGGGEAPKPRAKPSLQMIILLANMALGLAALGVFAYTKLLYQKPAITEQAELQKKEEEAKASSAPEGPVMVDFDQLVVNIAMTSGKAHYATLVFALECRDQEIASQVKTKKALFIDKVISSLAKRQVTELNTIQGKLLLKTELLREFNSISTPGGINNLYFSTFIVQ
ncbi:MAG: flagellar basal body-associated FliL family protein [Bdellovibrionota bacterium]